MKELIKMLKKLFKQKKGFTLIELLVVIGILGVLATALVATIDPFEQIKKAADSNTKNVLVEFNDANLRYYATHNAFPWDPTSTAGGGGCNGGTAPTAVLANSLTNATGMGSCVSILVSENELKQGFTNDTNDLKNIFITYDSTSQSITGCFRPQSKSQQKAASFNITGGTGSPVTPGTADCGTAATAACFWCIK